MIYKNILDLIGETPLIELNKIVPESNVFAKVESFNPGGSVKDRIAINMIEQAEKEGLLTPGATIVEPTSGNTGIGLAMVAAVKGYQLILVMPESMSEERRKLLKAYGAELVLTAKEAGMAGSIEKAEEILAKNPDYYLPAQFENPANPEAHEKTTALEILSDLDRVDALVVGVGTGGTLTGTGKVLKKEFPGMKIYAVEPEDSPVISEGESGSHMIQGIGAGFIPDILNEGLIDEVLTVENKEAFNMSIRLAKQEGLLVGISAGANVAAAVKVARNSGEDKNIVTFLPDTGERYLSVYSAFEI